MANTSPTPPPPPGDGPPQAPGPWGPDAGQWSSDSQPGGYAPTGPAEQPGPIRTAVMLMRLGAVLSAIGVLVTFLQTDAIRDAVEEADRSLSESDVDSVVAFTLGFAVVVGLVSIGLWLWMAAANGQGKRWARTVATVLGGISIVLTLLSFSQDGTTTLNVVVSLVSLALAAVILWMLWRPESTAYYDRMSGPR